MKRILYQKNKYYEFLKAKELSDVDELAGLKNRHALLIWNEVV